MERNEYNNQEFRQEHASILKVKNFESAVEVLPSLEAYKEAIQASLPAMMDSYKHSEQPHSSGTFALSEFHSGMGKTMTGFHQDGSFGFSLGYKQAESDAFSWFAHTSITVPTHLYWVPYESLHEILAKQDQNAPVIVQLQGKNTTKAAEQILRTHRWEFALTRLITEWALAAGAQNLYMLPADLNSYAGLGNSRFKMRYDVTAQRMGFRKVPGGLHTFSFADEHASQNG